jgi:hypothetical protein
MTNRFSVLGYMMDIESDTITYLREMLSTPVALDPSITVFLFVLGIRGILPLAHDCETAREPGSDDR